MKLLHFADLHLGMENYGRVDPATGLNSRFSDFLRSFDCVIDHAIETPVDAVIFAGDAFRGREPSPTYQNAFAARIRRLNQAQIPILLLVGNHDLPALVAKNSSLDVYSTLEIPGVVVARTPAVYLIETRSGPLQVAALPALPAAQLLEEDDRKLDAEAREARTRARTAEIVSELADQVADNAPAILAAHVGVEGAAMGSESYLMTQSVASTSRSILATPAFDYVALGHVHKHQDLNPLGQPPVVYAGSLERVDFSEENEAKGFVEVELLEGEARWRFLPVPARRFVTIETEADGPDATAQILRLIAQKDVADAVVRVIVRMTEETPLDEREIRRALSAAAWVSPITKQVSNPRQRLRNPELALRAGDPLAALDIYLKSKRFSEARQSGLRELAGRLLAETRAEEELLLAEEA